MRHLSDVRSGRFVFFSTEMSARLYASTWRCCCLSQGGRFCSVRCAFHGGVLRGGLVSLSSSVFVWTTLPFYLVASIAVVNIGSCYCRLSVTWSVHVVQKTRGIPTITMNPPQVDLLERYEQKSGSTEVNKPIRRAAVKKLQLKKRNENTILCLI